MAIVLVGDGLVVVGCGSGTSSDSVKDAGEDVGTAGSVGTGGGGGVGGTGASGGTGGSGGSGVCQQAPVAIVSGLTNAYGIAVDDANVYWTDNNSGTVMKAPKTGGTPQVLASGEPNTQFMALDAAHVYWTDGYSPGGRIGRVAKDGGPVETVASVEGPRALALDTSTVYFTVYGLGSPVMSAPLAGGQATILADAQPNGRGIAVYQGIVYWGNQGAPGEDRSIMQLPVTGGTPSVLAANQGGPGAVAVDASGVYWGNFKQPARGLMMIPVTGGTALKLASDPIEFGLASMTPAPISRTRAGRSSPFRKRAARHARSHRDNPTRTCSRSTASSSTGRTTTSEPVQASGRRRRIVARTRTVERTLRAMPQRMGVVPMPTLMKLAGQDSGRPAGNDSEGVEVQGLSRALAALAPERVLRPFGSSLLSCTGFVAIRFGRAVLDGPPEAAVRP